MIEVLNPKFKETKSGAGISFNVEVRDQAGNLGMRINGCRVLNGWLFGPSRMKPGGGFVPQVEFFFGLKDELIVALQAAGWQRDFPSVKFPELKELVDG